MDYQRLNDRRVATLKTKGKRRTFYDYRAQGLRLTVYKNGSKVWQCRPRLKNGKQKLIELGRWCYSGGLRDSKCLSTEDAREVFTVTMGEVRSGAFVDSPVPQAVGASFGDVATRYFAFHRQLIAQRKGLKKKITLDEEERVINNSVLPSAYDGTLIRDIPITEVTPEIIRSVLHTIAQRGSLVMRERTRAYISNVFSYAIDSEGLLQLNPISAIKRITREKPRTTTFSDDEVWTLWELWTGPPLRKRENASLSWFFTLSLLTMARRHDLMHMEWKRIRRHGTRGWVWTIPTQIEMPDGQVEELIKNGIDFSVPLPDLAVDILNNRLRPISGKGRWVFPASPKKKGWPIGKTAIQKTKNWYQAEAGLEDFRLHDLRSIGSTILARLRVDEKIIGYLCNHKPRSITAKVYIREQERYFEERRAALEKLATYVQNLDSSERIK